MPEQVGIRYFLAPMVYQNVFYPLPKALHIQIGSFYYSFKTKEEAINAFLHRGQTYINLDIPRVIDPIEMLLKINDYILYTAEVKPHFLFDNPDVSDDTPIYVTVIDGIPMNQ